MVSDIWYIRYLIWHPILIWYLIFDMISDTDMIHDIWYDPDTDISDIWYDILYFMTHDIDVTPDIWYDIRYWYDLIFDKISDILYGTRYWYEI